MLRIGIAFSLKPTDPAVTDDGPDDRFEEFDSAETVEAIASVIEAEGHDVMPLGDGRRFLVEMLDDCPDFVFNFAEGQGVGRDREARVPAVCEMLGVPYSGSDPLTLAVSLDKDVAKRLVTSRCSHAIVGVPGTVAIPHDVPIEVARSDYLGLNFGNYDRFPLILKPALEGSSKGIRADCIADDLDQATSLFARLARDYRQTILAEDFIEGEEVTVGVIGNGDAAEVLGVMRVVPNVPTDRFVYSLDVKRDWKHRVTYEAPARLPEAESRAIEAAALAVYHALGCRDLARIDFRIDEDGHPFFIEANPLPGLSPGTSDLVILAEGYGIGHDDLIRRILNVALERVGLAGSGPRLV